MKELKITSVWNVPYHYKYNDACEKYWAQLKAKFRPMLLEKMLQKPHYKEKVLNDCLMKTMREAPLDSIPKFVAHGLRALRHDANLVRQRRGMNLQDPEGYDKMIDESLAEML